MSWEWEYDPSEEYLVGGADPGFVAQVEARADELARAAAALYLEGSAYQGENPKSATAHVPGGMFEYLIVVRHERIYIRQVTVY
ncbi:hypothetical protein ABZ820_22935 [Streptomyces diacarni]|uniref:hypothetical protein n=1 Tax=Streptomyces diacarni TaxID=2800381 RepID=UPI0033E199F3